MREPPADLSLEILRAALDECYGLTTTDLTFLPLGHDASAWVYRVRSSGNAAFFLKVRRSIFNEPGLLVPRYLQEEGIEQVIAPLPTLTGALWTQVGSHAIILYPFMEGTTGKDGGMTPRQWVEYGRLLRGIHDVPVPPCLARHMRRETFVPERAGMVRKLDEYPSDGTVTDPCARALATFWGEHRDQIHRLLNRTVRLGRQLAEKPPPFVICHADIHTANVLIDTGGEVHIVDWDETVLAPRERDLMFVTGGGISERLVGHPEEGLILQGYGAAAIDPLALTYYRYAWAVNDIGAFGEEVFFRPDLGQISRQEAADLFMSLFLPGEIVALAFAADAGRNQ